MKSGTVDFGDDESDDEFEIGVEKKVLRFKKKKKKFKLKLRRS